jgi:DNA-binding PadR family transcriptional regulator
VQYNPFELVLLDYSGRTRASEECESEMERKLLLLGLLRSDEMHGYQLNEFIDSHFDTIVSLKKPTAYRLLDNMTDDGWVTHREERDGNRPPRRVFTITPDGEAAFQRLLRESLVDYQPIVSPGNIGLLFLHVISPEEAVELLQKRREKVESVLKITHAHEIDKEQHSFLLLHQTRHLTTELEWLAEVIAHFKARSQNPSTGQ